ncbi:hypothetical protein MP228_010120 [Amoeboaphelidium protococcarum]|nr:hypothetical protein MP228_010120 [Amoeboaphelidium protococcarum]
MLARFATLCLDSLQDDIVVCFGSFNFIFNFQKHWDFRFLTQNQQLLMEIASLFDFTSAGPIGHQVSCINEQFELDVTELKSQWRLARGVIKDKRIASKESSLERSDQLGIEFALKKFAHGKVV